MRPPAVGGRAVWAPSGKRRKEKKYLFLQTSEALEPLLLVRWYGAEHSGDDLVEDRGVGLVGGDPHLL